jgi:RNA polymerase sigma factor (sigma-70 family)
MVSGQLHTVLRQLRQLTSRQEAGGLTDAQLLERFAARRDQAAFEVLVWRHGPMVLGVCRRVLRHAHDAEDAFQATFLTLVRKGGSISKRAALPGWLYKVAHRIALRARAGAARRARREQSAFEFPAADPAGPADSDLRPVLDEEVRRLPEKYRLPVVLCYLAGKTTAEAARQLGCPKGTVLSRLAWARQRLKSRLTRRGLTLTGGAAAVLSEGGGLTAVERPLVEATVKAGLRLAAGEAVPAGMGSGQAVILMEGVLRAMFMDKMKTALAVVLALAVIGAGVGLWTYRPATADSPDRKKGEPGLSAAGAESKAARDREAQRPVGQWERVAGPYRMTLRVEADRLFGTFVATDKGGKEEYVVEADYSVTKDCVLFGVVTGLDAGDAEATAEVHAAYVDQPFSVRFRVDGNVLTIKDVKCAGIEGNDTKELQIIVGRYKRKTAAGREAVP